MNLYNTLTSDKVDLQIELFFIHKPSSHIFSLSSQFPFQQNYLKMKWLSVYHPALFQVKLSWEVMKVGNEKLGDS